MTDTRADPAAIEADIRQTQDNMSRTVEKIGNQFTAKNLFNALLDKADDSNIDARAILDGARRNPVALGLIAVGAIWLISDNDAKIPSLPKFRRSGGDRGESGQGTGSDASALQFSGERSAAHRDYLTHMSAIEQGVDEDMASYQRRRDTARSNFFMVERGHEEDDAGFRRRLDAIADTFRTQRQNWSERSGEMRQAVGQRAAQAAGSVREGYAESPLVGGIIAAAIGAAVGASLPLTRQEEDKLARVGEKARGFVGEQRDRIASQIQEKADALFQGGGGPTDVDQNRRDAAANEGAFSGVPSPRPVQA